MTPRTINDSLSSEPYTNINAHTHVYTMVGKWYMHTRYRVIESCRRPGHRALTQRFNYLACDK